MELQPKQTPETADRFMGLRIFFEKFMTDAERAEFFAELLPKIQQLVRYCGSPLRQIFVHMFRFIDYLTPFIHYLGIKNARSCTAQATASSPRRHITTNVL